MSKFSKSSPGQILIEVLLALSITSMALVALARIATKAISNTGVAQVSTEVKLLAEKNMEWLKEYKRRALWTQMLTLANNTAYCTDIADSTFTAVWTVGRCNEGNYTREVVMSQVNPQQIEAKVIIRPEGNTSAALNTLIVTFYNY